MRISFDILLLLALFIAPFYAVCILALIGLVVFPRFVEFILATLILELTYRGGDIHLLGIALPLIVFAILCLLITESLKVFIRTRMI